jgi:tRNA-specific 2-thiouridylase
VIIGPKKDLYKDTLIATNMSWVCGEPPAENFDCEIKIRNLHLPARAHVTVQNGEIRAQFDEPQISITAGQSAVLYDGDIVLGGGIIQ